MKSSWKDYQKARKFSIRQPKLDGSKLAQAGHWSRCVPTWSRAVPILDLVQANETLALDWIEVSNCSWSGITSYLSVLTWCRSVRFWSCLCWPADSLSRPIPLDCLQVVCTLYWTCGGLFSLSKCQFIIGECLKWPGAVLYWLFDVPTWWWYQLNWWRSILTWCRPVLT